MAPLKASGADLEWTDPADYDLPESFGETYYLPLAYTQTPVKFLDGAWGSAAFIDIADDNAIRATYGHAQEALWVVLLNLIPTARILIYALATGMRAASGVL